MTATHWQEPLQTVPVAVSVLDGEELERANLNNVEDFVERVPASAFRTGTSTKNVSMFIRGLGTITTSGGIEPTIATVVDGVVLAHPGQTSMDLLDVDRVEVLRGPQGTLFGKNASGGVFNVVTRDPSEEQYRYAEVAWYEGEEKRLRAAVAEGLSVGTVWGSLTGLYATYPGDVTDVDDGERLNGYEKSGLRGKLVVKPEGDLKVTLGADYFNARRTTVPVFITDPAGAPAPVAPVVASSDNRAVHLDEEMVNEDRNWGASGQIDWTLGGYTLTSITAVRQWDNRQRQDVDLLPISMVHDSGTVSLRQESQEIRLASPTGRRVDYVAGAFYQHSNDRETYRRELGVIADASADADFGVEQVNYALFGEGRFSLTPASRLIAGLRQTHHSVDYDLRRETTLPEGEDLGVFMHNDFERSDGTRATGNSGRLGAQFDLSPRLMVYGTWSRGYKGPAYNVYANMWSADTAVVRPEISDAYELGLKFEGLDDRLRLDLALFSAEYDDYQTALPGMVDGVTVMRLANAGRVGTSGLEADFRFLPTSRWEITGAYARTHARVLNFDCGESSIDCVEDGSALPFAPDHRLVLGSRYRLPLADGRSLTFGGDYRWQSEVQFQLPQNPDTVQEAYGILDASLTLEDALQGWRLALVGKNLTDQSYSDYMIAQFDGVARFIPRDDRRYFGIVARQDF